MPRRALLLVATFVAAALFTACSQQDPPANSALAPGDGAVTSTPASRSGSALRAAPAPSPTSIPRPPSRGIPPPAIEAAAYLVVDGDTGATLLESNASARLAPASLTKIATAIVVLERNPNLDAVIEVHPDLEKLLLEDSSTMKLLPR